MSAAITVFCLSMLAVTAVAIAQTRSLLVATMLLGIFSLIGAGWQVVLDAPDVAFTEAAVGAGISTVLLLAALHHTTDNESPARRFDVWPLLMALLTGGMLIYGTLGMPEYGDPDAPIHHHVAPAYIAGTVGNHPATVGAKRVLPVQPPTDQAASADHPDAHSTESTRHAGVAADHGTEEDGSGDHGEAHGHEIGVPNLVTAVLASYRGYDTLGETTVIFTAGIGCLALLGGRRRDEDEDDGTEGRSS